VVEGPDPVPAHTLLYLYLLSDSSCIACGPRTPQRLYLSHLSARRREQVNRGREEILWLPKFRGRLPTSTSRPTIAISRNSKSSVTSCTPIWGADQRRITGLRPPLVTLCAKNAPGGACLLLGANGHCADQAYCSGPGGRCLRRLGYRTSRCESSCLPSATRRGEGDVERDDGAHGHACDRRIEMRLSGSGPRCLTLRSSPA